MDTGSVVVLGFGPQRITFFADAEKMCGRGAQLDTDLARMAGAAFAVGIPAALEGLRAKLAPAALAAAKAAHPELSKEAVAWLAHGERGVSSNTMFEVLLSVPATSAGSGYSHPRDTADLRRCRLLLDKVPELAARLPQMASLSPEWAALVGCWDDLCALMDGESPDWRNGGGRAPETYALMRELFRAARAA